MDTINPERRVFFAATVCGQKALLTKKRIALGSIPEGLNIYHIRHSDFNFKKPMTVEPFVMVNYYGAIIMAAALNFGDDAAKKYLNYADVVEKSSRYMSLQEYLSETK